MHAHLQAPKVMNVLLPIFESLSQQKQTKILIKDNIREVSVLEFKNLVASIYKVLPDITSLKNQRIGIYLKNGFEAIVIIYAILCKGFCYVPLDINSSIPWLASIASDAKLDLVLGQGPAPSWCNNKEWINIDKLLHKPCLSANKITLSNMDSEEIAVILYTSGSTGNPKGIAISHRALINFINWSIKTFSLSANDRIINTTPLTFDLSFFDIFAAFQANSKLYIPSNRIKMFPIEITEYLHANKITTWYTVPSILRFWAIKGNIRSPLLDNLRQILFAGEKIAPQHLRLLVKLLPKTSFYNLFGPAETNVCCYWKAQEDLLNDTIVPIGNAACGALLKLNHQNELLVNSPCIASGYIGANNLLKITDDNGWYHTGDYCTFASNNNYIFHERLDRMFKSYGHKIEPSAIENVAIQFPNIAECAVVPSKSDFDNTKPVLFIVGDNIDIKEYKKFLKQHLPPYAFPSEIKQLSTLPRLTNGKLNIQALYNNGVGSHF